MDLRRSSLDRNEKSKYRMAMMNGTQLTHDSKDAMIVLGLTNIQQLSELWHEPVTRFEITETQHSCDVTQ